MPYILHLETATEICSVGISKGHQIISHRSSAEPYQHVRIINQFVDQCLREANISMEALDAVAISKGPGSFTALRVGTATAKGICYALDKPLIAVDTLQALALASWELEKKDAFYIPMIDARRMEVYTATFNQANEMVEPHKALIVEKKVFEDFKKNNQQIILSGNGAEKSFAVLKGAGVVWSKVFCAARHLVPLAVEAFENQRFEDLAYFAPLYFKSPNITTPKKNL